MYCYKVCKVEGKKFVSMFAKEKFKRVYKINKITKAIKETGVLCFEKHVDAENWRNEMKDEYDIEGSVILKCICGKRIKLGQKIHYFLLTHWLFKDVRLSWKTVKSNNWPTGTVAYDWIKPIKEV